MLGYPPCPALVTDLYQLTMGYGYWRSGVQDREAVFHLIFRENPFGGGFSVACGLSDAIDYLQALAFGEGDIAYLGQLTGLNGEPLFAPDFLEELRRLRWVCDVDAVPEGTVVFPHEPLLRVQGPLWQAQLVETALLNLLNFQTLIATKAARVCLAAAGDPVLEFGLRRAQGVDGAMSASRAAYVGGCAATSNVLAGKRFGIPVRGTHAHSWVMAFDFEAGAFRAYSGALPNNVTFLVDTYDTLGGVRHAIEVGRELRANGHELAGIRLDSGDLAWLSRETRRMLDSAGFAGTAILATNDLDEYSIASLKAEGAAINVWGVGTRLVTAFNQPALGGVYKLSAVRGDDGAWRHKIKLSEQATKVSTPGLQQVRRFVQGGAFLGDMIFDLDSGAEPGRAIVDPLDSTRRKEMPPEAAAVDLLVPIFRRGNLVYERPKLASLRERTQEQLRGLDESHKRFLHPHQYPVGLSPELHDLRTRLIETERAAVSATRHEGPHPG